MKGVIFFSSFWELIYIVMQLPLIEVILIFGHAAVTEFRCQVECIGNMAKHIARVLYSVAIIHNGSSAYFQYHPTPFM